MAKGPQWMARRLRQVRVKTKMSQAEVARRLGVSRNTICQYEQARRKPSLVRLRELACLYGLPVGDLIEGRAPTQTAA